MAQKIKNFWLKMGAMFLTLYFMPLADFVMGFLGFRSGGLHRPERWNAGVKHWIAPEPPIVVWMMVNGRHANAPTAVKFSLCLVMLSGVNGKTGAHLTKVNVYQNWRVPPMVRPRIAALPLRIAVVHAKIIFGAVACVHHVKMVM